ncbi:hypothetical protein VTK73DRAFT_2911 [Phialemonium thermophilum]|uniref:Uncharacterized protein n=1 Tax=Phialemonium thermophilum TaxID=223376 RepID=A0ABR3VMV3_9PEZI
MGNHWVAKRMGSVPGGGSQFLWDVSTGERTQGRPLLIRPQIRSDSRARGPPFASSHLPFAAYRCGDDASARHVFKSVRGPTRTTPRRFGIGMVLLRRDTIPPKILDCGALDLPLGRILTSLYHDRAGDTTAPSCMVRSISPTTRVLPPCGFLSSERAMSRIRFPVERESDVLECA